MLIQMDELPDRLRGAAFSDDDSLIAEYEAFDSARDKKIASLYKAFSTRQIDCAIEKTEPSKIGRSTVYIWTSSSREDSALQRTDWLCDEVTHTVMAMGHYTISTKPTKPSYTDRDAEPVEGTVYGWKFGQDEEPDVAVYFESCTFLV